MELKDLTIHFLGDSITEGYGVTAQSRVFHQIIKETYHLTDAYNYGLGGTRIARQIVPSRENPKSDLTFELRSETMAPHADIIVVFGGTNDYGHGDAPFGTWDSEDRYTFCGAVNALITTLQQRFPRAKLIFMTPLHRADEAEPSSPDGKILADYANAIVTVCNRRKVAVIDLFGIDPLDPRDPTLVPDGLHPNDAGHAILAQVIARELLK